MAIGFLMQPANAGLLDDKDVVSCHGCNNLNAQAYAYAYDQQTTVDGHIYTFDSVKGEIKKYRVEWKTQRGGESAGPRPQLPNLIEVAAEPAVIEAGKNVVAKHAKANGSYSVIQVPDSVVGSAFDMVNSPAAQRRISDYINNSRSSWEVVADFVSALGNLGGSITSIPIRVTFHVVFPDGSRAMFTIVSLANFGSGSHVQFGYIANSGVDKNLNTIPDSASAVNGVYEFAPGTLNGEGGLNDFLMHLENMGVRVVRGDLSGGGVKCQTVDSDTMTIEVRCRRVN